MKRTLILLSALSTFFINIDSFEVGYQSPHVGISEAHAAWGPRNDRSCTVRVLYRSAWFPTGFTWRDHPGHMTTCEGTSWSYCRAHGECRMGPAVN